MSRIRVPQAIAGGVIGLSLTIGVSILLNLGASGGQTSAARTPPALDSYPGFGLSAENSGRDFAIAYGEAFLRERETARCMSAQGFEYAPNIRFDDAIVLRIASQTGLVELTTDEVAELSGPLPLVEESRPNPEVVLATTDPRVVNADYVASLDVSAVSDYFVALHGVSALEDHSDAVDETTAEKLRSGGSGGCIGDAWTKVGSIWDLSRELEAELRELQPGLMTEEVAAFGVCTTSAGLDGQASNPGDIENAISSGEISVEEGLAVLDRCYEIWRDGYASAKAKAAALVADANRGRLEASASHYDALVGDFLSNNELRHHLVDHVEWIRSARPKS